MHLTIVCTMQYVMRDNRRLTSYSDVASGNVLYSLTQSSIFMCAWVGACVCGVLGSVGYELLESQQPVRGSFKMKSWPMRDMA